MYRLAFIIFLSVSHPVQANDAISGKADLCGESFHSKQTENTISIQTLNVYTPVYARDKSQRIELIVDFLKKNTSGIIFFQEFWSKKNRQNIEEVSEHIGMKSIAYDDLLENRRRSGLVTILKGDVLKEEIHYFSSKKGIYDFFMIRLISIKVLV